MTQAPQTLIPALKPGERHTVEQTIKRSRFIATFARVTSPEEAKTFVEAIRAEHAQATHNCWAFAAGEAGDTARVGASDDGEPKGTAGRPMLTALLHSGVGEVAVVVTRYFGGILLGTGGLVRAYQGSVKLGLESLPTAPRAKTVRYLVSLEPSLAGPFEYAAQSAGVTTLSSDFTWDASYEVAVPEDVVASFLARVAEMSAGEAIVECLDEA